MPKAFYSTREVAEIMGICRASASELMRMFYAQGKAVKLPGQKGSYRIRMSYFKKWLYDQDGMMQ